jgi:transketolase
VRTAVAASPRTAADVAALRETARLIRRDVVRMIHLAGSGHPGGSLSSADLVAVLYFDEMRHDPKRPDRPDRDRFIMSRGHGCPAQYAAMARAGYFPRDLLWTLRRLDSPLQGHPDRRRLPGIEASTGSLGQGLSIGIGMALARRLDGADWRTYVLLGDGEIQEGQVWQDALVAASHRVGGLVAIIDANGQQLDDDVARICPALEPIAPKFEAFGWAVREIDGHAIPEILDALAWARGPENADRPVCLVARTVKGKGVSFMEMKIKFHGTAPRREEMEKALAELGPAAPGED